MNKDEIIQKFSDGFCYYCCEKLNEENIFAVGEIEKISQDGFSRLESPYIFVCSKECAEGEQEWHQKHAAHKWKRWIEK